MNRRLLKKNIKENNKFGVIKAIQKSPYLAIYAAYILPATKDWDYVWKLLEELYGPVIENIDYNIPVNTTIKRYYHSIHRKKQQGN